MIARLMDSDGNTSKDIYINKSNYAFNNPPKEKEKEKTNTLYQKGVSVCIGSKNSHHGILLCKT